MLMPEHVALRLDSEDKYFRNSHVPFLMMSKDSNESWSHDAADPG